MKKILYILLTLAIFLNTTGCSKTSTDKIDTSERNETIVSFLKNGFSIDTFDTPIIDFDSTTNTYIVIARSQIKASAYEDTHKSNQWDRLVAAFSGNAKGALENIKNSDKNANLKVILTAETIPILVFEDNAITFDYFSAQDIDKARIILEAYLCTEGLGATTVLYEKSSNTYNITVVKDVSTKENTKTEHWEGIVSSVVELSTSLKGTINVFDKNSFNVRINLLDYNDGETLLSAENGNLTYNYAAQ